MISSAEQKRREAAARYARATMALEGARQTSGVSEQIKLFVAGEVSIEQAIQSVRQSYGLPLQRSEND